MFIKCKSLLLLPIAVAIALPTLSGTADAHPHRTSQASRHHHRHHHCVRHGHGAHHKQCARDARASDIQPPSAPGNLSAVVSSQNVTLSWSASTDNVGVRGYEIYRNSSRIATVSSAKLSYADSGLVNGTTYSYYVVAYDRAGNYSAQSNSVSATPQAPVPNAETATTGTTTTETSSEPTTGSTEGVLSGPTYYVSTSGSDANPGTQAAPWRTAGHAASAAGPGGTVLIESGSYPEDVKLTVSGAPGSPITFEADSGAVVSVRSFTIAASYVSVENLTVSGSAGNCITVQYALSNVTIQGNKINNCAIDGIHFVRPGNPPSLNYTSNSLVAFNAISAVGLSNRAANDMTIYADFLTVQGNDMTGTPNDAVDMWGDHLVFRRNSIHDIADPYGNHDDAFQTWTGLSDGAEGNPVTNLVIDQNMVVNVTGANAHGVMLEGPGHLNWVVRNNIFANIGSTGMILGISGSGCYSPTGLNMFNNTFYNAGPNDDVEFNCQATGTLASNIFYGGGGVYLTSGTTVVEGYNLFYGTSLNRSYGLGDKTNTNPNFAGASTGDFRLLAGSPAIDTGDNGLLDPVRPYDYLGNPVVSVVDRGAYEYQP
jgi:chitodextrinase